LFSHEAGDVLDFGRAVHALFATVEWGNPDEWEKLSAAWADQGLAGAEVLACLREPGLAALWTKTAGAEVWRERPFEVVLGGAWVTGVFDRVTIEREPGGRAVHASVLDFKTDRVESHADVEAAVVRHAGQLNLYRRAVAVLASIPLPAVTCGLVLTRLRRRVSIPPA
jgi:hypothetical protein